MEFSDGTLRYWSKAAVEEQNHTLAFVVQVLREIREVKELLKSQTDKEKDIHFQKEIQAMKKDLSMAINRGELEEISALSAAIADLTRAGVDIDQQLRR